MDPVHGVYVHTEFIKVWVTFLLGKTSYFLHCKNLHGTRTVHPKTLRGPSDIPP